MTRALLVLGITLAAALPAQADLRHVMTQSAQISVDQAYSSATRGGTTYSSQGTNVTPSVTDGGVTTNNRIGGLDMSTITSGVPDIVDTNYDVTTAGSAYSMTESLTVGDSIPTWNHRDEWRCAFSPGNDDDHYGAGGRPDHWRPP